MIVLTLRTDKPEAEIGIYDEQKRLAYEKWQAHRQLSETLHGVIAKNLQLISKKLGEVQGIVVFQGPGSFTGLRIGVSVANALAYVLDVPIVGSQSDDWIKLGLEKLQSGKTDVTVIPDYGSPAHTTQQKK